VTGMENSLKIDSPTNLSILFRHGTGNTSRNATRKASRSATRSARPLKLRAGQVSRADG
jgi:hypothetical protein